MTKCALHAGRGRPPKDCPACASGRGATATIAYRRSDGEQWASEGDLPQGKRSGRQRRSEPADEGLVKTWPPRWLSAVPEADRERGDGEYAAAWISALCRVTMDSLAARAGSTLQLREWQKQILKHLLARNEKGLLRHRMALVGVARKNAKSTLSAGLGLFGLLGDPEAQGTQIFSCAGDKEQARVVFSTAKRMVEMEPELSREVQLYRDSIYAPKTGSTYRVLSSEAYTKEGLNPSLVIFDEVHVQPNRELWDVMAQAQGARREPLMLGITTAGNKYDVNGQDSLAYQLYEYGKRVASGEVHDPTFFFCWYEPTVFEADHTQRETWIEANPGFGDLVAEEDFQSTLTRTPEYEFRQKRCNQWTTTSEAWLPHGAWDKCAENATIPRGSDVVLGLDGSWSNDATAVVAVRVGDDDRKPHIEPVKIWEADHKTEPNWRVPIFEVEDVIREACKHWTVLEIAMDPARWGRTYQQFEDEGLPVVEFPQTSSHMTPATQSFYEYVVNRNLTHNGDPALARHISNAHAKADSRGLRIRKESQQSARKIDAAVAAIMALARANWHQANGSGPTPLFAFV